MKKIKITELKNYDFNPNIQIGIRSDIINKKSVKFN